ncbi:MAG: hypothetical protein WBM44_13350, partial [Waterburya sp.]
RQALRIMCANELTSFMSPGSTLAIIGHTDRVGRGKGKRKEKRNLVLSAMRSQNTLQAIEDILGSKLKIPQKQIKPQGKGEQAAKEAGRDDKIPNPKDRRVDIILNSRLVLTLNG